LVSSDILSRYLKQFHYIQHDIIVSILIDSSDYAVFRMLCLPSLTASFASPL